MKYLFYLISFIFPTLCSSAQPAERDSSIYIASSRLYRMGESLVVSMQVDITRQIPSNESVILVPRLSDSLDNFIQLPAIYVNGRKQHIFFQRIFNITRREMLQFKPMTRWLVDDIHKKSFLKSEPRRMLSCSMAEKSI